MKSVKTFCYPIPVLGIMGLLHRIADTSMTCRKDAFPFASAFHWIQFEIHELIHIFEDQHIAVELHHSIILD